jgi:hypothetical protein
MDALTHEENTIWVAMHDQFMAPEVRELDQDEVNLFSDDLGPGWYYRLSAPGYLDCTDWYGPFATEIEAMKECIEVYGDFAEEA